MGLLDSFPTYEKTKKKKNSAKKSSKTSGQKNRVEYRHRDSSKSSKATTKTKKRVSSAKKKAKSSASSSGGRNQVEYRHRDTDASSESSLLSKELPVAKERKENTERDTALTPKMNLPYGNPKKPTTSASSASPKGFGDFRVAQREQEKNQAKPLNLQYLSSAITGNTRKDQGAGQKNAVSTALSMPSFSAERKEDTNRNTAAKTIAGPVDVSLKTITELGHEGVKANAAGKRDKSLNLQYLSNEFVNNLLNQGTKRTSDTEKMYHPFDYEKIEERNETAKEITKLPFRRAWTGLKQAGVNIVDALMMEGADIAQNSGVENFIPGKEQSGYSSIFGKAYQSGKNFWSNILDGNFSEAFFGVIKDAEDYITDNPAVETGKKFLSNIIFNDKTAEWTGYKNREEMVEDTTNKMLGLTDTQRQEISKDLMEMEQQEEALGLNGVHKKINDVFGAAGEMLPSLAAGAITRNPDVALSVSGASAYGGSSREALEQGADLDTARDYGYGSAGLEIGTERLFAGMPFFGKGVVDDAVKSVLGRSLSSNLSQALQAFSNSNAGKVVKRFLDAGGEASEEMISTVVQPFLRRATYDPDAANAEWNEIKDNGKTGFLLSLFLNAPGIVVDAGRTNNATEQSPSPRTTANRRNNQNPTVDTAADVGNSNMLVAPNEKRNSNHRPAGDVAPTGYTPEALNDTVSINSIPDPAGNINPLYTKRSEDIHQLLSSRLQLPSAREDDVFASVNSIPDSAENINPFDGKDMETIKREYQEAVDDNITEFVERVLNNDFHPKEKMNIGKIPERSVRDISDIVHFDVNNYSTVIKPETIQHIVKRHGENGQQDHSMANIKDISRIRYVLDNYDIVEPNPGRITGYSDKNGKLAQSVRYIKRVNGNYYAVVAVPDTARKEMVIVTAYKNKADQQAPDATNGPRDYVRNVPLAESASNNNIPDSAENINPRNEINSNPADGGNGYQNAIDEYGVQKEPPATPVPNQTAEDNRVSRFAQTEMDSGLLNEAEQDTLRQRIVDGEESLVYIPFTDVKAQKMADTVLSNQGFISAYNQFKGVVDGKKRVTKGDIALGERLIVEANAMGDTKTRDELLADVAILGREAGQAVQAISMLSKQSPIGILTYYERFIDRTNNRYLEKYGNKYAPITLNEELKTKLLNAKNREEITAVEDEINQHIVSQIPATLQDKIDAWRYLAMLGNPKTHLRNIIGNTLNNAMRVEKNAIGSILEAGFQKVGKLDTRTKTFYNPFSSKAKELRSFAKDYFKQNQDEIMLGGKYEIDNYDQRRIYNNNILEGARKRTSGVLEAGDTIFSKPAFVGSFTSFAMANNMTLPELRQNPEMFERARQYATLEAQKSTFREASELANTLNYLENKNAYAKMVIGGIVPFKKTPANIAKRAVEYSPVGLLDTVTRQSYRLRQGNITVNEYIDKMAAGLTGTSVAALGAFLASMGIISIGGDDENEKNNSYQTMQGEQNYSLNIGNQTFSLDWAAPSSIPLFFGAEVYHMATEQNENADEETIFSSVMEMVTKMTDPMLEMSMLDGLNSALTSFNNDSVGGTIGGVAANTVESYLGQFIPTLLRQTASTLDPTQRSSYVPQNAEMKPVQKYLVSQLQKIPGVRNEALEPNIDHWGREQTDESNIGIRALKNFLSPANIKANNTTDVDREIERLYDATGQSEVIPTLADGKISINGKDVYLSREQLTQYRKTRGNTAYEILNEAIKGETYQDLSDEEKAKYVQSVYDYSALMAKDAIFDTNDLSEDEQRQVEKMKSIQNYGIEGVDYFNAKTISTVVGQREQSYEGENAYTVRKYINGMNLDGEQKVILANELGQISDEAVSKAQNCYSSTGLSYDDFYTAYMEAQNIEGQIKTRGKQYTGEASDSKRALVMGMSNLGGEQQIALASALGCFSDTQINNAQTALKEANIGLKDYFKVYTEVNQLNNMLESQGISGKERLFQLGKFIAGYDNFTKEQKSVLDNFIVDDSVRMTYDNDIDYTDEWTAALTRRSEKNAALIEPAIALGIPTQQLYVIFTNLNGFEADKDANGKSVSGSLRKKSMAYIDSMPISNEQKNFFFNTVAGYSGSPRWGNINFGKQGKGIASFSESELTVDNEGNPINQSTAETASTTSLTPAQQAIHNMMGSFVEKIHQHPETKAISAAITAANAVSSGLSHTPNTNALQQAIWAPFFARVYGDQAASPQEEQSAFTGVTEDNGRFPAEIINAAMQSQIEDGIPAAITLAQWAQESGYGAHMPANSNNPFGITAGRGWTGKTVQGNNAAGTDPATYRVYDSLADAFKDHAAVLKNGYYDIDGLDVSDVDGWIGALQGVYATDPNYGNALRQIIEDNYLSQYTEMAKQYSASSLSAAGAPNTIYSPVDISKINTGYPFGAPKTGGRSGTHKGTDFSVPTGTPVTAVADGTVIKAGSNGSAYGNSVLVDMGNGYYYQYNHLSDWGVKAGDTVKAGDIICKSGNTGSNNTGAHLEIEVYQGSPDYGNQIDPVAYFGWGDAEPGTVIHSTDSGNYQSQGSSSGNGSSGSGSSSGSTSQGWGYSSSGIPYAYDGSLYRSSNYRNSRTSLAGNGGRYSFEGRSLPAYQYMGPRNDLFTGNSPAPTESKGKVVYAAPDNGVNRVVVDNGDGTYTSYRNVGEINVKRGDYADESTILAGTNPDQVEVEIIQGNFLINNNDLQAYSRQLGA